MAKVCISGYYGYDSIGDELVLMSVVNALRQQSMDMEIVVFSADPEKTKANFDVTAIRSDQWESVKNQLKTADLLISGGGHLLKETAELKELKYYLKVIKTALRFKMPVYIFNQTIGPFKSSKAKNMTARVLKKVRKITVADRDSVDVVQSMGIRRGRIHVMDDPILTMKEFESEWNLSQIPEKESKKPTEPFADKKAKSAAVTPINYDGMEVEIEIRIVEEAPEETIAIPVTGDEDIKEDLSEDIEEEGSPSVTEATVADDQQEEAEKQKSDAPEVAVEAPLEEATLEVKEKHPPKKVPTRPHNLGLVMPSFWKKPEEKFVAFTLSPRTELPVTQITAMADYMVDNGYQVVFLPLHYPDDVTLAKDILGMMKNPAYEVDAKMTPQSLLTAINEVDFVFSSEIYPMMMAAVCKKPFASLCFTTRDEDFVKALGLTPTGTMLSYDGEAFIRNFKSAVADPAAISAAIEEALPQLQEKAAYGIELLQTIFEQIARKKARAERAKARNTNKGTERSRENQAMKILGFHKTNEGDGNETSAETALIPEENLGETSDEEKAFKESAAVVMADESESEKKEQQ